MKRKMAFAAIMFLSLFFLFSCVSIAGRPKAENAPSVARNALKSTLMLNINVVEGLDYIGSAFFVSWGDKIYIISAGHNVVTEDAKFSAEIVGQKEAFPLKLLYYREYGEGDFALFSFNMEDVKVPIVPLEFAQDGQLKPGDYVISVGAPSGVFPYFTIGLVSANLYDLGDGFYYVLHSAAIFPGNSGGPLLDLNGKVVGMNTRGILGTIISFAVPVSDIKKYMIDAVGYVPPLGGTY